METVPKSGATHLVILSSGRLAARIAAGRPPAPRDLFLLTAAIAESAKRDDARAIELACDSAAALLESLPADTGWDHCRGYLRALLAVAWLFHRPDRFERCARFD